jgi:hypothetical protein
MVASRFDQFSDSFNFVEKYFQIARGHRNGLRSNAFSFFIFAENAGNRRPPHLGNTQIGWFIRETKR